MSQTFKYRIQYTGAPYGQNEEGHTISRHKTLEAAIKKFDKLFSGTTGHLTHKIQNLDGSNLCPDQMLYLREKMI